MSDARNRLQKALSSRPPNAPTLITVSASDLHEVASEGQDEWAVHFQKATTNLGDRPVHIVAEHLGKLLGAGQEQPQAQPEQVTEEEQPTGAPRLQRKE